MSDIYRMKLSCILSILTIWACLHFSLNAFSQRAIPTLMANTLSDIHQYRPDSAYLILKNQLLSSQADGDLEGEAHIYHRMGRILFRMGSYPQALAQLLEADKRYRNLDQEVWLAENNNVLGTVYYYNKQPSHALDRHKQALVLYQRQQDAAGLSVTYAHIGHWQEKNRNLDSALHYQRIALAYAESSLNLSSKARIYEHLGSIYEDLSQFDSSRYYYEASLSLYRSLDLRAEQVEVINNIGDVYSKTGNYVQGLAFARQAMLMASDEQDKYQLQSAFRDMAECFEAMGNQDSAYAYLEKSRELVQDIYTADNQKQIALLQTVYEFEQKNAEISKLNAGRKVYTIVLIAIVMVALLLVILGKLVNSRQKLKIQHEQRLNDQQQRIHLAEKDLMESALRMKKMEEESLKEQLDMRSRELSSHILHLIQKNEVMEEVRTGLQEVIRDDKRDQKKQLRQLLNKINFSFAQDDYWNEFRLIFDKVHAQFFTVIKEQSPDLTPSEIRLLALVKMELGSADMAKLLGVTMDSLRVMRYRVKKKLGIDTGDSLQQYVRQLG
jgi:tetratricopeptide (TPR) repeat protein/DNA-binding CsgD family transcriptional regulator